MITTTIYFAILITVIYFDISEILTNNHNHNVISNFYVIVMAT